jgi:hypothetical protein
MRYEPISIEVGSFDPSWMLEVTCWRLEAHLAREARLQVLTSNLQLLQTDDFPCRAERFNDVRHAANNSDLHLVAQTEIVKTRAAQD